MPVLTAVFCLLAGAAAAVTEVLGRRHEAGVLKMLAATAYLVFALALGAESTAYGRLVLTALTLSWIGDLFLIGTGRFFLAGLASFLLAHIAYISAFLVRGVDPISTVAGAGIMLIVGLGVMRWLRREELPRPYVAPVAGYVVAIGGMVALALGAGWPDLIAGGADAVTGRSLTLGAGAFAVADILVARHRFVRAESWNRLVGVPLYLAGQLLLASTV